MIASILALLIILGLAAWGIVQARSLKLEERQIAIAGLPAHLRGRRILHLSDAHLGPRWNLSSRILSLARSVRADWTFVTGDLTLGKASLPHAARLLENLAALNPTWVVPGNAEYAAMRSHSVPPGYDGPARLLLNRAELLADGEPPCWIAGVDCPHRQYADPTAALSKVPPNAWTILLAHSPDVILQPDALRARLIFTGHTHGGQVRIPGLPAPYTNTKVARRFAEGVHDLGGTTLVVSRGAGVARLPVRFFCPPELTVWTLVPGGYTSGDSG